MQEFVTSSMLIPSLQLTINATSADIRGAYIGGNHKAYIEARRHCLDRAGNLPFSSNLKLSDPGMDSRKTAMDLLLRVLCDWINKNIFQITWAPHDLELTMQELVGVKPIAKACWNQFMHEINAYMSPSAVTVCHR